MSWNYGADPYNDPADEVRLLVGDTDSSEPLIQDEEIFYLLSKFPTPKWAAAAAAKAIAAKFARKMNKSVGPLRIDWSQRYDQYVHLAKALQSEASLEGLTIYAGGLTTTDKQLAEQNSDRVPPKFTRTLHELPEDTQFSTTPPNPPTPYP